MFRNHSDNALKLNQCFRLLCDIWNFILEECNRILQSWINNLFASMVRQINVSCITCHLQRSKLVPWDIIFLTHFKAIQYMICLGVFRHNDSIYAYFSPSARAWMSSMVSWTFVCSLNYFSRSTFLNALLVKKIIAFYCQILI